MTGALESRLRFYATGVADMRNAEAGMFLAIKEAEGCCVGVGHSVLGEIPRAPAPWRKYMTTEGS